MHLRLRATGYVAMLLYPHRDGRTANHVKVLAGGCREPASFKKRVPPHLPFSLPRVAEALPLTYPAVLELIGREFY